jgi:hypothetical protein
VRITLLVFYIDNILVDKNTYQKNIMVDKNTLCNGCKLTGWSIFNSESSRIQTVFKLKHVTDHKLLEDVYEESLQISSQINRFLYNRPNEPLKASGRPAVSNK